MDVTVIFSCNRFEEQERVLLTCSTRTETIVYSGVPPQRYTYPSSDQSSPFEIYGNEWRAQGAIQITLGKIYFMLDIRVRLCFNSTEVQETAANFAATRAANVVRLHACNLMMYRKNPSVIPALPRVFDFRSQIRSRLRAPDLRQERELIA